MKKLIIILILLMSLTNVQANNLFEIIVRLKETPCHTLKQLNQLVSDIEWEAKKENSNFYFGYVDIKLPGYENRKARVAIKEGNDTIQSIGFSLENITEPKIVDFHKEFVSYNIGAKQTFIETDSAIYHHEEWLIKGKHRLALIYEWSCGAREGTVKYSVKQN